MNLLRITLITIIAMMLTSGTGGEVYDIQRSSLEDTLGSTEGVETLQWLEVMQQSNGLLLSSEVSDFVSLYDNALAVFAFTRLGDFEKAEKILSFYQSRMPYELTSGHGGFYQSRNALGNEGERSWLGDNAWLLLATRYYQEKSGDKNYTDMSLALEEWIRSLQDEDGGIRGGWNSDGSEIHKITEGIITAFKAVPGYDNFHKGVLRYLQDQKWDSEQQILVTEMGTSRYSFAMDLHSLGYLILDNPSTTLLRNADRFISQHPNTLTGETVKGYCFDEDKDVIWIEGTAQMALAYRKSGDEAKWGELRSEILKNRVQSDRKTNTHALTYSTNMATAFGTEQLWAHADLSPALSANLWFLFAELNFNPFSFDEKKVPLADQFWNVAS